MINAEFRFILIDGKPVKQWRDFDTLDEWKNVTSESPKEVQSKICQDTIDMFELKDE